MEYKSPIKIPSAGESERCFYPFRLDTYGCGCSHNCLYCYSKSTLQFRNLWNAENARKSSIDVIRRHFDKHIKTMNKLPVRIGGMTDCFGNNEKTNAITMNVIKYLNEINYPYFIITKNKLVADYHDILDKNNCIIQITITTEYDELSSIYEEGASLSSERISAGKYLSEKGFYTIARINPLFPIYQDEHFTGNHLFANNNPFNYFTFNLPHILANNGFKTIIAGFLRLTSFNIKYIKEKTGNDISWLFTNKKQTNGSMHFSVNEIKYYYEHIKNICDKYNVDFSVCYDSDINYDCFKYLWANQNDCCNMINKVDGFRSTFI